jgi:hypothetical protein
MLPIFGRILWAIQKTRDARTFPIAYEPIFNNNNKIAKSLLAGFSSGS